MSLLFIIWDKCELELSPQCHHIFITLEMLNVMPKKPKKNPSLSCPENKQRYKRQTIATTNNQQWRDCVRIISEACSYNIQRRPQDPRGLKKAAAHSHFTASQLANLSYLIALPS